MTVNQRKLRFASLVAFALVAGATTVAPAGVIPWTYDAIFGPVRYPAYGSSGYGYAPYNSSYAPSNYAPVQYRYAPSNSGCSSCSTSYYAPAAYSSYGCGCGPTVAMAPSCGSGEVAHGTPSNGCLSGCSSEPTHKPTTSGNPSGTKSPSGKWTTKGNEPIQHALPKKPKETFETETEAAPLNSGSTTNDGLGTGGRQQGIRVDDAQETLKPTEGAKKSVDTDIDTIIPARNKAPLKDSFEDFEKPLEKDANDEAKIRLPLPKNNFDDKLVWRVEAPRTRIPLHAKVGKVTVVRHMINDNGWTPVVAKSVVVPQLVKK